MQKLVDVAFIAALLLGGCCGNRFNEAAAGGPVSTDMTAFTNVHLVPMTSEVVLVDQTLLVEDGRIIDFGPAAETAIPDGAQVIDCDGGFLLPGLADMHMHTRQDWLSERWPISPFTLYLANGITTVRDMGPTGDDPAYALSWRAAIAAGEMPGPRLLTSGELLFASPLDDPAGLVRANHAQGFDFLKVYSYLSLDDFQQAMGAAEEVGMYAAGHVPYPVGLETALDEGMDEVAHIEELLAELIQFERYQSLAWQDWLPYIIDQAYGQLGLGGQFSAQSFHKDHAEELRRIVASSYSPLSPTGDYSHMLPRYFEFRGDIPRPPESGTGPGMGTGAGVGCRLVLPQRSFMKRNPR